MTIAANDLKTKGISVVDKLFEDENEAVITVRGEQKYMILDMDRYNYLRECELDSALLQAKKDQLEGRFVAESVEEHIDRISDEL